MCIYPVPSTALDALSISSYVNFTGTPKARYYFSFQKIFQMSELRLRRFQQSVHNRTAGAQKSGFKSNTIRY